MVVLAARLSCFAFLFQTNRGNSTCAFILFSLFGVQFELGLVDKLRRVIENREPVWMHFQKLVCICSYMVLQLNMECNLIKTRNTINLNI